MRCWCVGYLSGTRCRLFAYGPADATAIPKPHHLLPHLNPDWFYLSGTGLPRLSCKKRPLNVCVCVCVLLDAVVVVIASEVTTLWRYTNTIIITIIIIIVSRDRRVTSE